MQLSGNSSLESWDWNGTLGLGSLFERWSQQAGERKLRVSYGEEEDMRGHDYGHCCDQGDSIQGNLPNSPSGGQEAVCCAPLLEGCFRGTYSLTFLGCTFSWPSSVLRTWDRVQKDQSYTGDIVSLRHTPPVAEIRGGPRARDTGHKGIGYSCPLLRITVTCQTLC